MDNTSAIDVLLDQAEDIRKLHLLRTQMIIALQQTEEIWRKYPVDSEIKQAIRAVEYPLVYKFPKGTAMVQAIFDASSAYTKRAAKMAAPVPPTPVDNSPCQCADRLLAYRMFRCEMLKLDEEGAVPAANALRDIMDNIYRALTAEQIALLDELPKCQMGGSMAK